MDCHIADAADLKEYNDLCEEATELLPIAKDLLALGAVPAMPVEVLEFLTTWDGFEAYEAKYASQVRYCMSVIRRADAEDEKRYQSDLSLGSPRGYIGRSSISHKKKVKS